MYINDVTGNVGIGTTSPDQLVHIKNPGDNGGIIRIGGNAVATGVDKRIRFGDGDFVAIGESPLADDRMEIRSFATYMNSFAVGIGTTSPTEKLEVAGTIKVAPNSIDATEIADEPGVSNSENPTLFFVLGSGNITYVLDSVDITIPSGGYVEVTCDGYIAIDHVTGTPSQVWMQPGKTRGFFDFGNPAQIAGIPAGVASSSFWFIPCKASRLFVEGTAGTYRYYLHVFYGSGPSGATQVGRSSIRAKYFPTLYGTVSLANAASGVSGTGLSKAVADASQPLPKVERTTITVADHNARVEVERARQTAEMEARIKRLEEQFKQSQQQLKEVERR